MSIDHQLLERRTELETEALYRRKLILRARDEFDAYAQLVGPSISSGGHYFHGMVQRILCHALQRVFELSRKAQRPQLILNTQPQLGKTHIASMFAGWWLGKTQRENVLAVSYNQELAENNFSRRILSVVRSKEHTEVFPACSVVMPGRTVPLDSWELTNGGMVLARGIQGGITGNPAQLIIPDDVIKNRKEANSREIRDKVSEELSASVDTRQSWNSAKVLIQTRWHVDDPTGRALKAHEASEYDKWMRIILQAEAMGYEYYNPNSVELLTVDNPLSDEEVVERGLWYFRGPGESVQPERIPPHILAKDKEKQMATGFGVWESLYQQNPVPESGEFFDPKNLRYYNEYPDLSLCNVVTGWDFALSENARADDNAAMTVAIDQEKNVYLIHIEVFKGDAKIVDTMLDIAAKYANISGNYKIAPEKHNVWITIGKRVKEKMREKRQSYRFVEMPARKNKLERSIDFREVVERGRFFIPSDSIHESWVRTNLKSFLEQAVSFTGERGGDDDMIDAVSMAVTAGLDMRSIRRSTPEPQKVVTKDPYMWFVGQTSGSKTWMSL